MNVIASGREHVDSPQLMSWLRHGDISLRHLEEGVRKSPHLERHNVLSQLNVLEQLNHLKTYTAVKKRLEAGSLRIHAWWFDIREADVYEFDEDHQRFQLIDEDYAQMLFTCVNNPSL